MKKSLVLDCVSASNVTCLTQLKGWNSKNVESNCSSHLTLGVRASITKVWPEIERLSDVFAVPTL